MQGKKYWFVFGLILIGEVWVQGESVLPSPQSKASAPKVQVAPKDPHPDRAIRVHNDVAKYVNLESGDYLHVNMINRQGKNLSFYESEPRLTYFILAHQSQWLRLRYETLEKWIPEGGGYFPIARMIKAQGKDQDDQQWWEEQCRKQSPEKVEVKFQKLLETEIQRNLGP